MKKQEASLLLMNKVIVPDSNIKRQELMIEDVATFNANLLSLGHALSPTVLVACISTMSKKDFINWSEELQDILIDYNGARMNIAPMYPGFPEQVMEMNKAILYTNALTHYMTNGEWTPSYKEQLIKFMNPSILKPKIINLTSDDELLSYVKMLAESPVSMSVQQKDIFEFLINEYKDYITQDNYIIPNKENMAFIIHAISKLDKEDNISHVLLAQENVSTITDALRLVMAYIGGDISLCDNYGLHSIKRKDRRFLLNIIDNICKKKSITNIDQDASIHQATWVVIFEKLHPGDYAKKYSHAYAFATRVRETKLRSWYSQIDKAFIDKDLDLIVELLMKRPGEFARRLDRTLRLTESIGLQETLHVIESFKKIAINIDSTILLQLNAYFGREFNEEPSIRSFFPKGKVSKVYVIEEERKPLTMYTLLNIKTAIRNVLEEKYSSKEKLGNVYIDDKIKDFALPLKLRNASSQLRTVPRGSKIKLPDNANIIRLYTWWKNIQKDNSDIRIDIDLSATLLNENFDDELPEIAYYNLVTEEAVHSGDFVNAPRGAAEFIDLDIDKLIAKGVRYVVMNINSYDDYNFNTLDDCFAGVMLLEKLEEPERLRSDAEPTFDPAKSFIRSDISTESTICVPMVFDLKRKEVVWVDSVVSRYSSRPNNVAHCKGAVIDTVRGIIKAPYPKLGELAMLHTMARDGKIVETKEEADIVFSLDEGITPYDLEIINSEWI